MSQVTTHILDTSSGCPANGVVIILFIITNDQWVEIGRDITDSAGRANHLLNGDPLDEGIFKLRFEISDYYIKKNVKTFYPYVEVVFHISSKDHYHVPLLLNPFGYSTYRGS